MGCDIHMYLEKLNPDTKEWEFIPPPNIEMYYYPDSMTAPAMGDYWYWGRNYSLFGMLANVRNGVGFAGVDIGRPVEPISMPRGIPDDASPEYLKITGPYAECGEPCEGAPVDPDGGWCLEEHGWGSDGHSHSWLTLRELQAVPWGDNLITHHGVVNAANYQHWKEHGHPLSYSGSVMGGDIRNVSNAEMERLIASGEVEVDDPKSWGMSKYYTSISWTQTWKQAVGKKWFEFLDRASALTLDDGSDVRAVFFFDN